jgi:GH24 family phage-related lysozyme (muramidase)
MQTGNAGINLIKSFESLSLKAYICPAGKLTVGARTHRARCDIRDANHPGTRRSTSKRGS